MEEIHSKMNPQKNKKEILGEAFFSSKGRINRLAYFQYNVALIGFMIFGIIPLLIFIFPVGLLVLLLLVHSFACLGIKRLHDMNMSGWYMLLELIPTVNFILSFILLFKKGTEGTNDYGKDLLIREQKVGREKFVK